MAVNIMWIYAAIVIFVVILSKSIANEDPSNDQYSFKNYVMKK